MTTMKIPGFTAELTIIETQSRCRFAYISSVNGTNDFMMVYPAMRSVPPFSCEVFCSGFDGLENVICRIVCGGMR